MSKQSPENLIVEELESLWQDRIEGGVGYLQPGDAIMSLSPEALQSLAAFWQEHQHAVQTEERQSPRWKHYEGRYHSLCFRLDRFDFHYQRERITQLGSDLGPDDRVAEALTQLKKAIAEVDLDALEEKSASPEEVQSGLRWLEHKAGMFEEDILPLMGNAEES